MCAEKGENLNVGDTLLCAEKRENFAVRDTMFCAERVEGMCGWLYSVVC